MCFISMIFRMQNNPPFGQNQPNPRQQFSGQQQQQAPYYGNVQQQTFYGGQAQPPPFPGVSYQGQRMRSPNVSGESPQQGYNPNYIDPQRQFNPPNLNQGGPGGSFPPQGPSGPSATIPTGHLQLRPELLRVQNQQKMFAGRPGPIMNQPRGPFPPSNPQPVQQESSLDDMRQKLKRSPQPNFVPNELPPHLATLPFPGPQPGVESTIKHVWRDKINTLSPKPMFQLEILDNLHVKSVGYLCSLGKDVIQELVHRVFQFNGVSIFYQVLI